MKHKWIFLSLSLLAAACGGPDETELGTTQSAASIPLSECNGADPECWNSGKNDVASNFETTCAENEIMVGLKAWKDRGSADKFIGRLKIICEDYALYWGLLVRNGSTRRELLVFTGSYKSPSYTSLVTTSNFALDAIEFDPNLGRTYARKLQSKYERIGFGTSGSGAWAPNYGNTAAVNQMILCRPSEYAYGLETWNNQNNKMRGMKLLCRPL